MYNQGMPGANRLLVMEEGDHSECERIIGSRKTAVGITKRGADARFSGARPFQSADFFRVGR
jgi:hypothetical protein